MLVPTAVGSQESSLRTPDFVMMLSDGSKKPAVERTAHRSLSTWVRPLLS